MRLHKLGNFLSWRPTSRYNWSSGANLLMQFREQIESTRFGVSVNQQIVQSVIANISIVMKLLNCGGYMFFVFHIDYTSVSLIEAFLPLDIYFCL